MKKLCLSLMLIFSILSASAMSFPESASAESGTFGNNLTWTLDSSGLLTISGRGEMPDWTNREDAPWYRSMKNIKSVSIENGVTNIGNYAFFLYNITTASIGDDVTNIGQYSFGNCRLLKSVVIPGRLTSIDQYSFKFCSQLTDIYYAGSEENWERIIINLNNDSLKNATIHYNCSDKSAIQSVSCNYENNKITAQITFSYIKQAGTLVAAVYNNGKLVTVKDKPASVNELQHTIEIDADESCIGCEVKVFCWENYSSLKPLAKFVSETVYMLESDHPYASNTDETKTYTYNGECASIDITFSDDTETEHNHDFIYIYDADDRQIGKYDGTELAGQTINVPGNTVKIRLTSDSNDQKYGYRITSIIVNK